MFRSELPAGRSERWKLLGRFIDEWFPRRSGEQGVRPSELQVAEQRLGVSLPIAFREWYQQYGARYDVWSRQDHLRTPGELELDKDVMIFATENQSVVRWAIRREYLGADDPPVLVSDPDHSARWVEESPSTSAFALQFAVLNVKWSEAVRYRAEGAATTDALAAIDRTYARLPFPELHWPAWPTRQYGRDDIIVETHADDWIWATTRSAAALSELDALVRAAGMDEWESYDD